MKKRERNKTCHMFLRLTLLAMLFLFPMAGRHAFAAQEKNGYEATAAEGTVRCSYRGDAVKDAYLCLEKQGESYLVTPPKKESRVYYFDKEGVGKQYQGTGTVAISYKGKSAEYYVKKGVIFTGWVKKGSKRYYYTAGTMSVGWKKIGGKKYYFDTSAKNKGAMLANTIAGTKKSGYGYVDPSGIQVTAKEVGLAVEFVQKHTKPEWEKSKKLKACFDYLWKHYSYKRFYETPKAKDMAGYAKYMLSKKKGNCYRYAASFAYIARVIGYDARVGIGKISSSRGGMTPHGWTEVKFGKKWYMCDANMQKNHPSINSYKKTSSSYAYRHSCSKRYKMTVKGGKVTWK